MFDSDKVSNYHPIDPANPVGYRLLREFRDPKLLVYEKDDILAFYESNGVAEPTMNDYMNAIRYLTKKQEDDFWAKHPNGISYEGI